MITLAADDFDEWRSHARRALGQRIPPGSILWSEHRSAQSTLPLAASLEAGAAASPAEKGEAAARVPLRFLKMAHLAACHRDPARWAALYRLLWRVVGEGAELLDDAADADVHAVAQMAAQVRRDEHKMRAFVRFTVVEGTGPQRYVAYYRPDHHVVRLAAPFFAERFSTMTWSILTPDVCAHWDGAQVTYSEGLAAPPDLGSDAVEDLWRTYYATVFNPARANVAAMTREMPRRHWATLPESRLIPGLLNAAARKVDAFARQSAGGPSARPFLPVDRDLPALRDAAPHCRGCDLYQRASRVVFGEGPGRGLMIVGEQPGDVEDRTGRPFVGPAGEVLERALTAAGIARGSVYVTNAVKHFSFEERGKRRIHKTPRASEVRACRPWLEAEVQAVRPSCVLLLGATAAQSLLGPQVRVLQERGRVMAGTAWAPAVVVSVHPSAVLRADDGAKYFEMLVSDVLLAVRASSAGLDQITSPHRSDNGI